MIGDTVETDPPRKDGVTITQERGGVTMSGSDNLEAIGDSVGVVTDGVEPTGDRTGVIER